MQITSIISTEAVERAMEIANAQRNVARMRGDDALLTNMTIQQASAICHLTGRFDKMVNGVNGAARYAAVAAAR